jgi:succinate dehydrogenase / fumarate reductase cytochrome b subunit
MNTVLTLYQSTIGKKIAMAVTGLILAFWVVMHMLGNLQVFAGAEVLDAYGHKIQSMGPLLWAMRAFMLAALVVHVASAISLSRGAMAARAKGYQGPKASLASISIGLHVFHGVSSAVQTMGGNHPAWNDTRVRVSAAVGALVMFGNLAIVCSIVLGLIG